MLRKKELPLLLMKYRIEFKRHIFSRKTFRQYINISNQLQATAGTYANVEFSRLITRHFINKRVIALLEHPDVFSTLHDYFFPNISYRDAVLSKYIHENTLYGFSFDDRKPINQSDHSISLSHSNIMPWVWNKRRLIGCMGYIGQDNGEPWEYDNHNHYLAYYYPLDMVEVLGGNHSITTGMLKKEGVIPANFDGYYDISELYKVQYFDGLYWHRKEGVKNRRFKIPNGLEFIGIIFEISRKFHQNGLSVTDLLSYQDWQHKERILETIKSESIQLRQEIDDVQNIIENLKNKLSKGKPKHKFIAG